MKKTVVETLDCGCSFVHVREGGPPLDNRIQLCVRHLFKELAAHVATIGKRLSKVEERISDLAAVVMSDET